MSLNPFAVAGLLVSITSLSLGIFVYLNDRSSRLYRLWLVFNCSVAVWGAGAFLTAIDQDPFFSLAVWRLCFLAGGVWIPVLFYFIVLTFDSTPRVWLHRALLWSGILFAILSATPLIFSDIRLVFSSIYFPTPGVCFLFFIAWWIGVVIGAHIDLIRSYRTMTPLVQNQIKYILLGSTISFIGGGTAFLPVLGIDLYPYGTFALIVYPFLIAYAILKHHLLDVQFVLQRAVIYAVGIALVSFALSLNDYAKDWLVSFAPDLPRWIVPIFTALVAIGIGTFVWSKFIETDRLKYEFILIAMHTIRAPLTSIRWGVDALLAQCSNSERPILQEVRKASDQLVTVTDRLFETIQADTNQSVFRHRFKSVDARALIEPLVQLFATKAHEKQQDFAWTFSPVPLIQGDERRLRFAAETMLDNALRYTPERGSVRASLIEQKGYVEFSVTDTGIGIPPEDLPYIFTKFYRSKNALRTETHGFGLGLSLAKDIIRQHRGEMKIYSEGEHRGTTVTFRIPIG